MRILFVTHYFSPDSGAAANRLTRLATMLQRRGHQVSILAPMPHYPTGIIPEAYRGKFSSRETIDGIEVIRVWLWTSPTLKTSYRLIGQLSAMVTLMLRGMFVQRPDVMFVENQPIFTGLAGWFISKVKRAPYLLNVSDYWPEYLYISGTVNKTSILYRIFEKLANLTQQEAREIVILWPGLRTGIENRIKHPPDIELIYNSVDLALLHPEIDGKPFRQKYGLSDQKLVTFLGVLGPHIDLDTMLQTARDLGKRGDVQVVFAGTGSQKDQLAAAIQQPDLAHCRWIEWVPAADIPAFWGASAVNYWALHDNEVDRMRFQAKLYEAMASGTPVVIAVEGLMSDVLRTHGTGITVAHGDAAALTAAIEQLLRDEPAYHTMRQNMRTYAEANFDAVRGVDAYESLLLTIAENHKQK